MCNSNWYHYGLIVGRFQLLTNGHKAMIDKAQSLYNYFKDRAKVSFGIGTYVMNDTNVPALNIVLKLQYVKEDLKNKTSNYRPVAKLSDNPEKAMCRDQNYLDYLKQAVNHRVQGGW